MNRRAALGLGTLASAGAVLAVGSTAASADDGSHRPTAHPHDAAGARKVIKRTYQTLANAAGGTWNSYVSVADTDGTVVAAVDQDSDTVVQAYSVNKIAVAIAVLDKVDRGALELTKQVEVSSDIVIANSDGILSLDGAYPSEVTIGHALALLLTVSDDTAVRLCGLVCTSAEINDTMVAKGFPKTQVDPVDNPHRFYLGQTTPREAHDLLRALAGGTLLSADSTAYLLGLLRSPVAYTDGIRRIMSSDERLRVATKAGWLADGRNEAGMMFDTAGTPVLTYSLFAHGQADPGNFGATHPAVQARALMGRGFFDAIGDVTATAPRARTAPTYRPRNGG